MPINKVDKITMNATASRDQLISYGNQTYSGYNTQSTYDNNTRTAQFMNSDEDYRSHDDNIYLKGGSNMAEVLQSNQGIAARMKKMRDGNMPQTIT